MADGPERIDTGESALAGGLGSMVICDHYSVGRDSNLPGVLTVIPLGKYDEAKARLELQAGVPCERHIGQVVDKKDEPEGTGPEYYNFEGDAYFMRNGVAQVGTAQTTANMDGFSIIRLFSRNVDEQHALRREVFGWSVELG